VDLFYNGPERHTGRLSPYCTCGYATQWRCLCFPASFTDHLWTEK